MAEFRTSPPAVVSDGLASAQDLIQTYGWYLLFLALIVYLSKDYVLEHLAAAEKRRQLQSARAGDRGAVHEQNARRARERQQQAADADAEKYRQIRAKEKAAKAAKAAEKAAEGGAAGGGGSRPLNGNRGGGGTIIHRIQPPSSTRRS